MMDGMNEQQGTHFWFMTIQAPYGGGYSMSSCEGTLSPRPGATRLDVFNDVLALMHERYPASRGGNVVAFDVQLNKI